MPTDRFPFAVFVGRQIEILGPFHQAAELADLFRFSGWDDVQRVKVLLDVHSQSRPRLIAIFIRDFLRACGRSRMWPMLASTVKSRPRNLLIVRALAVDSTITKPFEPLLLEPFFAVFDAAFLAIAEFKGWGVRQ